MYKGTRHDNQESSAATHRNSTDPQQADRPLEAAAPSVGWQAAGEIASLAAFDGLRAGGSIYLTVIDAKAERRGIVHCWPVDPEDR